MPPRALLLPRGSPRRRMPLWLQRLKALDLLEVVRQFPSFPILVETYREVLQDAFDLTAVSDVLRAITNGGSRSASSRRSVPSPFAAGLQFGFVMDWLYADDTPRAERAASRLSVDRDDARRADGRLRERRRTMRPRARWTRSWLADRARLRGARRGTSTS